MAVILGRRVQVAIKAEAVSGTVETLESGTGLAANAEMILASEADPQYDFNQQERAAAGQSFDTAGSVGTVRTGKFTFSANLRGKTTAFSSSNLPDLNLAFKACGCTVTFSGGAGSESVTVVRNSATANSTHYTIGIYRDGLLYRLAGALGNFKLSAKRGEFWKADFEFWGAYVRPSDVAMRTTSLSGSAPAPPPFLAAAASVLGLTTPRMESFSFDLGNELGYRGDPNAASGILTGLIKGGKSTGQVDPEATLVATKNWWSELEADTVGIITTGDFPSTGVQYNKLNLTIPKAKYLGVSPTDAEGLERFTIPFECQRNTDVGDDAWSLVFK